MHTNKLRTLLAEGKPSIATRIESTWPLVAEAAAVAGGFDYLEFVAEYAPYSQTDLENLARAAELHDTGSMIKLDYQNRFFVAQKALASGFQAVLLTDHHSAEEVRESIQSIRPATPMDGGRFGCPNRRFIGFQIGIPQMSYAENLRSIVIAVMIENKDAFSQLDEILNIPGVDMVQFGPSDYALSMGWNAAEHRPELRIVEAEMIAAALRHGVQPRCEIQRPEEAAPYRALGVQHFCIGDELRNNMLYWKEVGTSLRAALD